MVDYFNRWHNVIRDKNIKSDMTELNFIQKHFVGYIYA